MNHKIFMFMMIVAEFFIWLPFALVLIHCIQNPFVEVEDDFFTWNNVYIASKVVIADFARRVVTYQIVVFYNYIT